MDSNRDGRMPNTTFDVRVHGFHFDNGLFPGDILITIPGIGRVNLGRTSYALCGGMSYAALDTYLLDGRVPANKTRPPSGSELRSYIYRRQQDSFRYENAAMIRRFIEWTARPIKTKLGVTGLQVLSHRQFLRRIQPAIDSGHPLTLGILRSDINDVARLGRNNALLINHQVVAIGYELEGTPGKGYWKIHIYDPNFHDQIQTLHTGPRYQTAKGGTARTGSFRAFFVTPHEVKRPPWVPQSQAPPRRIRELITAAPAWVPDA
jgi:hypothetical protein